MGKRRRKKVERRGEIGRENQEVVKEEHSKGKKLERVRGSTGRGAGEIRKWKTEYGSTMG